jgi:hypothetical protein
MIRKISPKLLSISSNAAVATSATGPAGSLRWNYEDQTLHIYDGVTAGGYTIALDSAGGGGGGGGGVVASTPYDDFSTIMSVLNANYANYKNPSFYSYTLGTPTIGDGGGDMYDTGNATHIRYNGSQVVSNIAYNVYTTSNYNSLVYYRPVIYDHPLMMVAVQTPNSSFRYGIGKTGNLGADGGGAQSVRYIYQGATVNGFTVYAWARSVYSAGDPSVNDLYIHLTHPNWNSTFTSVAATFNGASTDSGDSYFEVTASNSMMIAILLSKSSGVLVTNAEMETIITAITSNLSTGLGW